MGSRGRSRTAAVLLLACATALTACSGDGESNDTARPQDLVLLGDEVYVDPCQALPPADAMAAFGMRELVVRHDYHSGELAPGDNPRPGLCRFDPVEDDELVMVNLTAAPGESDRKNLRPVPGLDDGIREAAGYFVKQYEHHHVTLEVVGLARGPQRWVGAVNAAFTVIDRQMQDPEQLQPGPTTAAVDGSAKAKGVTPWLLPCDLLTFDDVQSLLDVPVVPVAVETPARRLPSRIDPENACLRRGKERLDDPEHQPGSNPPSYTVELRVEYGAGFADDHWTRVGGPWMTEVGGVDALFAAYEVSAEGYGGRIDLAWALDSYAFLLSVRGEDEGDEEGLPDPTELVPVANRIIAGVQG